MRKVYLLVLFMMCIAASFPVYAKMLSTTCVEVITPVTMHKTNEDSSLNHKVPKRDPFELSCYLVGNANTIFLSANKVVSVEVEIENLQLEIMLRIMIRSLQRHFFCLFPEPVTIAFR